MAGFLLIAGGNPAKVFEFAKHAFDDMTLLVLVPVTASLHLSICLGRYHRRNVTLPEPVEQCIGVIPLVSQQRARAANIRHEGNRLGDVRCLASRQNKAHGQAQCICQRVNLATKTATRAAQRLGSRVACGRARSACMSPYYGAVDADILQVSLGLYMGQHLVPNSKPASNKQSA